MAENIRMDSHKLIYHPEVVARWLSGETVYPIEMEISLSSGCNHRCVFCSFEYMNHQSCFLNTERLLDNLPLMAEKGLKSIVYAGDGEPLLHRDAAKIIQFTKKEGIDTAISTNGVLLDDVAAREILPYLTWIRFSVSGITEKTYQNIQRGRPGDLDKVMSHIENAVKIKKEKNLRTTIGVQLILLPENAGDIVCMTEKLKKIGVDYFTVKPFMQHPQNRHLIQVDYDEMLHLESDIKKYEDDNFKIFFRKRTMENMGMERGYAKCWALPFMAYINAGGDVYSCCRVLGKDELKYGNIGEENFREIWEGKRRKRAVDILMNINMDKNCGKTCRMDEMNKYLQQLKTPGEHVNFI